MTQIESIVEPDGVSDDLGRESTAFVQIIWRAHSIIVAQQQLTCQYRPARAVIGVLLNWVIARSGLTSWDLERFFLAGLGKRYGRCLVGLAARSRFAARCPIAHLLDLRPVGRVVQAILLGAGLRQRRKHLALRAAPSLWLTGLHLLFWRNVGRMEEKTKNSVHGDFLSAADIARGSPISHNFVFRIGYPPDYAGVRGNQCCYFKNLWSSNIFEWRPPQFTCWLINAIFQWPYF